VQARKRGCVSVVPQCRLHASAGNKALCGGVYNAMFPIIERHLLTASFTTCYLLTTISRAYLSVMSKLSDFPKPYDRTDADIIICSSDGIHFRFYKDLLCFLSPIFRDMFSLPQGFLQDGDITQQTALEMKDDLPVVAFTEEARAIYEMLRVSFPTLQAPNLTNIPVNPITLLRMGDKFEIPFIMQHAKDIIHLEITQSESPMRAYTLACRGGLEAEARLAAKKYLEGPLIRPPPIDPALEMTAIEYHRLLDYHMKCGRAAQNVARCHLNALDRDVWLTKQNWHWGYSNGPHDQRCKKSSSKVSFRQSGSSGHPYTDHDHPVEWWKTFMDQTGTSLAHHPRVSILKNKERLAAARDEAAKCAQCKRLMGAEFSNFLEAFQQQVQKAIDEVSVTDQSGIGTTTLMNIEF
jgi:hypothetical protein